MIEKKIKTTDKKYQSEVSKKGKKRKARVLREKDALSLEEKTSQGKTSITEKEDHLVEQGIRYLLKKADSFIFLEGDKRGGRKEKTAGGGKNTLTITNEKRVKTDRTQKKRG